MPLKAPAPVRLLLLDARPDFGQRLESHLRNAGMSARVARVDNEAALGKAIDADESDLLLMDWDSQLAQPAAVIARIEKAQRDLPLITMSVEVDAQMLLKAIQAKVSAVLLREELAHAEAVIRREFERRQQRRAVARMKHSLAELEQRCEALLESSRDAIAYVHDGMHVRANQSYLDFFGFDDFDHIVGTTLLDMIDPERAAELKEVLKKVARDEAPPSAMSVTARRLDGLACEAEMHFARASFEGEPCLQITLVQSRAEVPPDIDLLTGLKNRQAVFRACAELVARPQRSVNQGALMLIEPDGFDRVVEAVGFARADELVKQISEGIAESARDGDLAARYSDHGFVLLLPTTSHDEAEARAQDLVEAFAGHVFEFDQRSFPLCLSMGLVLVSPEIASADFVLSSAARMLKQAQDAGGNQLAIEDPAAQQKADAAAEKAMVELIRGGIRNDHLLLDFQPVVSLHGAEGEFSQVLVRLQGPDGILLPGAFFPVAEKFGLIPAVDRWVIARACIEIAERMAKGRSPKLFVKISPRSLDERTLVPWIEQHIKESQIPGSAMIFELTESAMSTNLNGIRHFRDGVAALGCQLAIQDFGSAANAQQLLQHVGPNYLKLDRRLMTDLPKSPIQQQRLRELCEAARAAGRLTVGQFVEDSASMAVLFTLGVDFIQGDFLQEPEQLITA